jgi:hypothetical protein
MYTYMYEQDSYDSSVERDAVAWTASESLKEEAIKWNGYCIIFSCKQFYLRQTFSAANWTQGHEIGTTIFLSSTYVLAEIKNVERHVVEFWETAKGGHVKMSIF